MGKMNINDALQTVEHSYSWSGAYTITLVFISINIK